MAIACVTFPVPERSPSSWRCRTYAAIAAVSQLPCRIRAVRQASSQIPTTDLIVSDQCRKAPSDRKGSSSHQSLTAGQARASALREITGFAVGDSEACPFLFCAGARSALPLMPSRPRKTLGWRTPAEALDQFLRTTHICRVATTT